MITVLIFVAIFAFLLYMCATERSSNEKMWNARRKRWAYGGWDPAYPNDIDLNMDLSHSRNQRSLS